VSGVHSKKRHGRREDDRETPGVLLVATTTAAAVTQCPRLVRTYAGEPPDLASMGGRKNLPPWRRIAPARLCRYFRGSHWPWRGKHQHRPGRIGRHASAHAALGNWGLARILTI